MLRLGTLGKLSYMNSDLLKACHTTYDLKYHFVWIVKYRKGILFNTDIEKFLRKILEEIGQRYWLVVQELGTDGNHLHIFVQAAPRYSPSRIAQILKSISARELFKNFPQIKQELWGGQFWGDGFFVRSVGSETTAMVVQRYIKEQGKLTNHGRQLKMF